jgi:hypothetical protein
MSYVYRREDNGDLVTVGFDEMMSQRDGYITLPDGVLAKRCVYLENHATAAKEKLIPLKAEIVSDNLGCTGHQVANFREDAQRHGFTGVEFTPDPHEPTYYQARISSVHEWRRYLKHRCLREKNSRNGGGQPLSPGMLKRASERLLEQAAEHSV